MKVIIAGSRGAELAWDVDKAMTGCGYSPVTEIVSGNAKGPDRLGEEWARAHAVPLRMFMADWRKHGRAAGMVRNVEMARHADALVAVWDGVSRGTKHMIETMEALGKPVYVRRV